MLKSYILYISYCMYCLEDRLSHFLIKFSKHYVHLYFAKKETQCSTLEEIILYRNAICIINLSLQAQLNWFKLWLCGAVCNPLRTALASTNTQNQFSSSSHLEAKSRMQYNKEDTRPKGLSQHVITRRVANSLHLQDVITNTELIFLLYNHSTTKLIEQNRFLPHINQERVS